MALASQELRKFLGKHRIIGLDTPVFIFQIEENPKYLDLTQEVFAWLAAPRHTGVTATITMLEVLVQPHRDSDEDRVDAFYALLSTYPHLRWIDATLEIADRAAHLRAKFNLKTPDAIEAATALASGATGFISNDPILRRVPDLEVLILDDLLRSL